MPQTVEPRRDPSAVTLGRLAAAALALVCVAALKAGAQTTGANPPNAAAGAPAGSYSLSGFESVNLFSGNLNFRLPLLRVGGRGGVNVPVMLSIDSARWKLKRGRSNTNSGDDAGRDRNIGYSATYSVTDEASYSMWGERESDLGIGIVFQYQFNSSYETLSVVDATPLHAEVEPEPLYYWLDPEGWTGASPGYGPGVLEARTVSLRGKEAFDIPGQSLTRVIFTAPDGTEYELRDELQGGRPYQHPRHPAPVPPYLRGTVFVSADGGAATFIADSPVWEYFSYNEQTHVSYPSGYLLMPDGTRYRIRKGAVEWVRDRNGNVVTFSYGAADWWGPLPVSKITDSLGREVNFSYGLRLPPGTPCPYNNDPANPDGARCSYDEIGYRGFGGAARSIKVWHAGLGAALREGSLRNYGTLFPSYEQEPAEKESVYDAEDVVTAVELPDGRRYRLRYNAYNELARVELPTGGAFEYDYHTLTSFVSLQRAVAERRVYRDAGDAVPESRQKYLRAPDGGSTAGITVEERDGATGSLLACARHYFHGNPLTAHLGFYAPWREGREYKTEALALDGVTPLRRAESTWEARAYPSWFASGGAQTSGPVLDPRLRETSTTLMDVTPNLSTKQVFYYDTDPSLTYNLQTRVEEYGFDAELLRSTETEYLKSAAYTAAPVHLRALPLRKSVYDAGGVERARSTSEYDNYTPDGGGNNRHAALVSYADIYGLCTTFDAAGSCSNPDPAAYATRGNVTGTTSYLLDRDGNVTGSVTSNLLYDVAGNVVKGVGARLTPGGGGYETRFDFADNFGAPDAEARADAAPAALGGLKSYALPTGVTDALGHAVHTQYDYQTGQAVDFEDANGMVLSLSYGEGDPLDRLTRVVRAANYPDPPGLRSRTTYAYDDAGRKVTTTSDLRAYGDGLLKGESFYDGLGRTTEARQYEDATHYITTLTRYDALGRASEISNPYRPLAQPAEAPAWTTTAYDALGRVTEVTTPDGARALTLYDGARTLAVDQAGKQRVSRTDALGRLVEVWEVTAADPETEPLTFPVPQGFPHAAPAAGYRTAYGYDVLGNLRRVEQGVQSRFFAYDSLGRLLRASNPEQEANAALALPAQMLNSPADANNSWALAYEYDEAGNLRQRTDARGVETAYAYDALGRLTDRAYTAVPVPGGGTLGTPAVKYYYDAQPLPEGAPSFDRGKSAGRLVAVTYGGAASATGSYTGGYDALGRPRYSAQVTDAPDATGQAAPRTYAFSYEYNLDGSLKSETYPSGRVVASEYDAAGRLASVKKQGGDYYAGGDPGVVNNPEAISYTAHGAVSALRLGSGLWEHTRYNGRLQPTEIGLGASPADSSVLRLEYGYSPAINGALDPTRNNGNVLSQRISVPAEGNVPAQTYVYDALNRLETASEVSGAGPTWTEGYLYDRYGNRLLDEPRTKRLDGAGRLAPAVTDANRAALNPAISPATNRFTQAGYWYDKAGDLLCDPDHPCPSAGAPYYGYDGEGRMLGAGGGGQAVYAYDGDGHRVQKVVGAAVTVFVYDGPGRLAAEYSNQVHYGGTSYPTQDALGSTRVVTGPGREVKASYDFMPFGGEVSEGRVGDGGSTVRQKFTGYERDEETNLDYAQARYYLSAQGRFTSIDPLLSSGRSGIPQSWNRYSYVRNNPLRLIDPSGLQDQDSKKTNSFTESFMKSMHEISKHYLTSFWGAAGFADEDSPREVEASDVPAPVTGLTGNQIIIDEFWAVQVGMQVSGRVAVLLDPNPWSGSGLYMSVQDGDKVGTGLCVAGMLLPFKPFFMGGGMKESVIPGALERGGQYYQPSKEAIKAGQEAILAENLGVIREAAEKGLDFVDRGTLRARRISPYYPDEVKELGRLGYTQTPRVKVGKTAAGETIWEWMWVRR